MFQFKLIYSTRSQPRRLCDRHSICRLYSFQLVKGFEDYRAGLQWLEISLIHLICAARWTFEWLSPCWWEQQQCDCLCYVGSSPERLNNLDTPREREFLHCTTCLLFETDLCRVDFISETQLAPSRSQMSRQCYLNSDWIGLLREILDQVELKMNNLDTPKWLAQASTCPIVMPVYMQCQ